jgi:hypothetical protein
MRKWMSVVGLLGACVHAPIWSPQEQCAANGLVLNGVVSSHGETVAVASGGAIVVANAESTDESVSCRRPATIDETCEVRAATASLRVKLDFGTGWRNAMIGVGYVVYILPGLVLLLIFDSQKNSTADDAENVYADTLYRCRHDALRLGIRP